MTQVFSLSERDFTTITSETAEKMLRNRVYYEGRMPELNHIVTGFFFIEPADHASQTMSWLICFENPQDMARFLSITEQEN